MNFNLLNEMSDDDLIEEIINYQRIGLANQDRHALLHAVIQFRIQDTHNRLIEESGMECKGEHGLGNLFGFHQ